MSKAPFLIVFSIATLVGFIALIYRAIDYYGPVNQATGNCVVLVLGYPAENDGRLSAVQRVRVEAGVEAYRSRSCEKLVFSGGAVANQYNEAEIMASFAQELGIAKDHIIVERLARNTWENIGCSLSYLQNATSITIVSENLHAKRAKRYLCRQQPFLCGQVDIRVSQLSWKFMGWKVLAVFHELAAGARDLLFYTRDEDYPDVCPA